MKPWIARFSKIILIITLMATNFFVANYSITSAAESVSTGSYYWDSPPSVMKYTLPEAIELGWVNSDKVVKEATPLSIPRLPFTPDGYGAIETNIEVKRLDENRGEYDKIYGRAIAVSNLSREADAGYVFVHPAEAVNWIKVLNGNPNHVLSKITTYEIYSKEDNKFIYLAYNLAEIAYHSGGRGNPQGDGLKKSGSIYIKYDYFESTPRPNQLKIVASSSPGGTAKTTFKANETIYLQGTAKDYSFYDQGINPVNIAIVNNKTGGEYQSAAGASSLSKSPPLTPGIDIYKGTFVATDKHGRSVQGSSDYSASKPAEVLISVEQGVCTAISGTLKVSGQADKTLNSGGTEPLPSGKNTITLVFPQSGTLKVDGASRGTGTTFASLLIDDSTVIQFTPANATYCTWEKTFTSSGGGGGDGDEPGQNTCSDIVTVETMTGSGKNEIKTEMKSDPNTAYQLAYDTDTIMLEAKERGEFRIGNTVLKSNTGLATTIYSGTFPTDGSIFTLSFRSEDGKKCWEKKFFVGKRPGDGYDCPTYAVEGGFETGQISNGTRISKGLNSKLKIRAWFKHLDSGESDHVPVFWRITRPDGTVGGYKYEENDRGKIGLSPVSLLEIPDPNMFPSNPYYVGFTQVGTYTIEAYYDSLASNDPYKTWKVNGCSWKIYVEVSACGNTSVDVTDNGRGMVLNKDSESGEYIAELSKNTSNHQLKFKAKYDGNLYKANWVLKSVNSATPLHSATNTETFDYAITEVGEYILTITYKIGNETCVKTIRIIFGENCDDLGIVAKINNKKADVTGNGTKADPFVVYMPAGQDNRFTLSLTLDGQVLTDDYQWSLYRNDKFLYRDEVTNFSYTIPNGSAIYSVSVRERIDNIDCERWIVFRVGEPPEPEQPPVDPELRCKDVYMHLLTEEKNYFDVAPAPDHKGSASLSSATNVYERFAVMMSDGPTATGSNIDVKWETTLVNKAPDDFANSLFIGDDTPGGTYTIKATVEEPANPNINGCVFILTITITTNGAPPPPGGGGGGPGGPIDGGQMKIRVYDSGNRLLNTPNDGVWEKETARIEVTIDQTKINNAFSQVDQKIKQAIDQKKAELESKYSGDEYKNVEVTATPQTWSAKTNSMTTWPPTTSLRVDGPGTDATYTLNTKTQVQSNYYTGTIVPTQKDGVSILSQKYNVTADGFTITVKYKVDFEVNYEKCTKKDTGDTNEDGDPIEEEVCEPGSDSDSISNTFTINVTGDQTRFEVFDLYVIGKVRHTDLWNANRQAYNRAVSGDPESPRFYDMYWAGERFMLHADTPNTGASPVKLSSVKVTMSTTNLSTMLNLTNSYTGDGSLWRENFQYLLDGPYTFTFDATWNHGHTERDTYTIIIKGPYTQFFELHRLH